MILAFIFLFSARQTFEITQFSKDPVKFSHVLDERRWIYSAEKVVMLIMGLERKKTVVYMRDCFSPCVLFYFYMHLTNVIERKFGKLCSVPVTLFRFRA